MASESLPPIPALAEKRSAGTTTHAFIGITGPSLTNSAHGFGIVFTDEAGSVIAETSFKSTATTSTNMRGALGATLTSLEFGKDNLENDAALVIHSKDEYICLHLPKRIRGWVLDPNTINIDLLEKITPLLGTGLKITFAKIPSRSKSAPNLRAKLLAAQAQNTDGGFVFHSPNNSDTEAMRRAIARDPY